MPPTTPNQYDNRPFLIATLDPNNTGQGYIVADGLTSAAIRGAEPGSRYALAPVGEDGISFSGDSADFIEGPLVGAERVEFIAKRGGLSTGDKDKDIAPWSPWVGTPEKFTAILDPSDVVHASPRAPEPDASKETPLSDDRPDTIGDHILVKDAAGNDARGVIVHAGSVATLNQIADKIEHGGHVNWAEKAWQDVVQFIREHFPHHAAS